MFVTMKFHNKVTKDLQCEVDELKTEINRLYEKESKYKSEIDRLRTTIESINKSNVVPYSKINEGCLVMNSKGRLIKVQKIGSNWVLNLNYDKETLSVSVPYAFTQRFGKGPVSKKDLIRYMKSEGYRN
tara:strand:- start:2489 stop:2875 length:387 start_codon:yes stop_codon:yes gene_type:complete